MGNSCVTCACRGSDVVQTTFKWSIDGFSSLLDRDGVTPTYSNVFKMRGLYWHLKLNPRDTKSGDQNEYVSLRLELVPESGRSNSVVKTTFKFLIHDQLYGKHYEQQVSHNFQSTSTTSGISCMIPLAKLKEYSSGFLVNNSCVFCVELISVVIAGAMLPFRKENIGIAKANDVSETLFVRKMKNSEPQVYTWNIEDFFVLTNPSYSPEFELCGHKWSITVYPSGDDTNGNYLSLHLVMIVPDTLHKSYAYLIEKCISIKNQETGKGVTKQGRSQYSRNCDIWGFDKFMSLEDFKDPANGYLVKTKCCIEVQVAVMGTSKMKYS